MQISYAKEELREYCCSLLDKSQASPFVTSDEIIETRALLADLRSAPCLAEAPVIYKLSELNSKCIVTVIHEKITINCIAITLNKAPSPEQIRRLKIVEILKSDLQISNIKNLSA